MLRSQIEQFNIVAKLVHSKYGTRKSAAGRETFEKTTTVAIAAT